MIKNIALLVITLLLVAPVPAQEQGPKDTFVIAIASDFGPFTFLNVEGKPAGMFVDIWQLWAKKTGKQIQFISSDWKTSFENLKNQKASIHSGFLYSPEHFAWINVSQPLYEGGVTLFYSLKQGKISDINELSGQAIAVIGKTEVETFLKENYPDIKLLPCDTITGLVNASREGKAKGFIAISPVGTSLIDRMGVSGEFETYDKTLYRQELRAGVLKKDAELLALVDKGFNAISNQEFAEIEARWIPDPAKRYYEPSNIIELTRWEAAWVKNHKTVRVGMAPAFPPLKFSEKRVIKGIEPDYLALLSEYTGLRFEYVIGDFSVMDAKAKSGEIDMFLSFYIPERLAYMTLTEPFMEFKQVVIARNDASFISGLDALKGKKVATVKGVRLYDKILSRYPDIEVVQVGTIDEMFKAVSEFKADALIARTYTASYLMQNYPNLKIAGVADIPLEPYYFAVRKDYPELVSILNKAIASIPKDMLDTIVQKWSSVRLEYRSNWSQILKWALVVGGAFVLVLGLMSLWNMRLAREIERRKLAEQALRDSRLQLSDAMDLAHIVYWEFDLAAQAFVFNDPFYAFYGTAAGQEGGYLMTREDYAKRFIHPDDLPRFYQFVEESALRPVTELVSEIEHRIIRRDGEVRHILGRVRIVKDDSGRIVKRYGANQDITERKRMEEQLQTMSLADELTGLYNRRGFLTLSEQQLKIAWRTKKEMLLFFTDMDKMKHINDTLGHQEGDKALFEVATILKEVFRESDIMGRIGGDEFAILAIATTDGTREVLTSRLHNFLEAYNRHEGRNYTLSLSIGIAHYDPEHPSSLDELMAQADTLMYEEKRNKRR